MNYLDHLYIVVLCGGGGTRVWPLSVSKKPKQFLNFYSEKTLYQETVGRAKKLVSQEKIFIITNQKYVDEIKQETPEIPTANIIGEPEKKNTAMAMGTAALYIKQKDPEAVIINLYSDHVITNEDVFLNTLKISAQIAFEDKCLMTIGVTPTFPHPGLGYIKMGEEIKKEHDLTITKVDSFKEKPDYETAKQYVESGKYLWNAGFYIWRVDQILQSFKDLSPNIYSKLAQLEQNLGKKNETVILKKVYQEVEDISIDFAISEKSPNLCVVPGGFGWYDIGGWKVVYELGKKNENGNVLIKNKDGKQDIPAVSFDAKDNLVYYSHQPVALIGVENLVVVDTGEGLLICHKEKANDVKKVVQELQDKGYNDYV
ncbi:mannose-1-phosphate guanylyltransferase [Candidatus Beckwithbacteria bacterium]|nr:mannose-1-phosphate guanylyltransferase [Candidatus Beckwithbacteria bacterium]